VKVLHIASRDLTRGIDPRRTPWLWFFSLLYLVGSIAAYYATALSFGTATPVYYFAWAAPIVFILMQFPLSFGGWGPREAAALVAFSGTGTSPERVAAIAAGFGIVLTISGLLGLAVLAGDAGRTTSARRDAVSDRA
jgi:uncharacterized membrane protein YbhN (UPF0104 family)